MRFFNFLVGGLLALLAFPSLASDTAGPVERVQIRGGDSVEYQLLFEAVSETGEALDAFVLRIAPRLRAYSDETGFEACGVLATDGDRFGIIVGTNRSHAACGNADTFVPAGMKPVGQTLHSHRTGGMYRANKNDRALIGGRVGKGYRATEADTFSAADFTAPGYLVGSGAVWHQIGKRTVRRVSAI